MKKKNFAIEVITDATNLLNNLKEDELFNSIFNTSNKTPLSKKLKELEKLIDEYTGKIEIVLKEIDDICN